MPEPTEHRTCTICKKERRTTISELEEKIYICEICLRDKGRKLLLGTTFKTDSLAWKGLVWIAGALVLGILLGKFVF